jgi:hypothetical protein
MLRPLTTDCFHVARGRLGESLVDVLRIGSQYADQRETVLLCQGSDDATAAPPSRVMNSRRFS